MKRLELSCCVFIMVPFKGAGLLWPFLDYIYLLKRKSSVKLKEFFIIAKQSFPLIKI